MKSFVISLIFLICTVIAVFINSYFSSTIYGNLMSAMTEFPDRVESEFTDDMIKAKNLFEKHSDYFSYVLQRSELLDFTCDFSDIFEYYRNGDTPAYKASLERALERLRVIKRGEKISLKEIFGS